MLRYFNVFSCWGSFIRIIKKWGWCSQICLVFLSSWTMLMLKEALVLPCPFCHWSYYFFNYFSLLNSLAKEHLLSRTAKILWLACWSHVYEDISECISMSVSLRVLKQMDEKGQLKVSFLPSFWDALELADTKWNLD